MEKKKPERLSMCSGSGFVISQENAFYAIKEMRRTGNAGIWLSWKAFIALYGWIEMC